MPFLSTSKTRAERYDVVIVGSGAGGGMAAHVLAHAGVKVLLLEAGRRYDPETETPMFQSYADAPLRGIGIPEKTSGFFDATIGGWTVDGEPYIVRHKTESKWMEGARDDRVTTPQNFMWWRARMLGGRTNHWGRVSLRMGPIDLKPFSADGLGVDWPISYEDIAPYYDKTDKLVGIFGSKEGIYNNPDSDFFMPPPKARAFEHLFARAGKKLGMPVIPARIAILTKPLNGRAACFYATACYRGCSIGAAMQSPIAFIKPALTTGNLDVLTHAMAREVVLDAQGRATGVRFIDKKTGQEAVAYAKAVVLAASALESTRILLNSRSEKFPQGLGNSSGHLGRWLTDCTGSQQYGHVSALENMPLHNEDGTTTPHTYAPWTVERQKEAAKAGVPRGYYISWHGGRTMPSFTQVRAAMSQAGKLYGSEFKAAVRRYYGAFVEIHARGEMIPNKDSFCELDPERKDRWGTPVLRFHFKWSDHEVKQVAHQQETFVQMIESIGGKVAQPKQGLAAGGSMNHEAGVARMSAKREDGVTNPWSQLWDCPNVVVADAGVFCSNSKPPTLTIMALAWRACDRLIAEMKRGNLRTPV